MQIDQILSQKSAAVDSSGRWMRDWFTVIGDIINGINKSRVTWSGKRITYTEQLRHILRQQSALRLEILD